MSSEKDDDEVDSYFSEFNYEEWERDHSSQEDEDFDFNFGGSSGRNVSGYIGLMDDGEEEKRRLVLTKFQGEVILDCRSEVLMFFTNKTFALLFRLTHGRQIFGYGEGLGKLFRGILTAGLTDEEIEVEAFKLCRSYALLDGKGDLELSPD